MNSLACPEQHSSYESEILSEFFWFIYIMHHCCFEVLHPQNRNQNENSFQLLKVVIELGRYFNDSSYAWPNKYVSTYGRCNRVSFNLFAKDEQTKRKFFRAFDGSVD